MRMQLRRFLVGSDPSLALGTSCIRVWCRQVLGHPVNVLASFGGKVLGFDGGEVLIWIFYRHVQEGSILQRSGGKLVVANSWV